MHSAPQRPAVPTSLVARWLSPYQEQSEWQSRKLSINSKGGFLGSDHSPGRALQGVTLGC